MSKPGITAGLLLALGSAGLLGGQPAVAADTSMCIGCHSEVGNSLKGEGVDAIKAKINDIATGKNTAHAPVVQGASDEEIAALAAALNEAE